MVMANGEKETEKYREIEARRQSACDGGDIKPKSDDMYMKAGGRNVYVNQYRLALIAFETNGENVGAARIRPLMAIASKPKQRRSTK